MEREIGSKFNYGRTRLIVSKGDHACRNCHFAREWYCRRDEITDVTGKCEHRLDGELVYFKRVKPDLVCAVTWCVIIALVIAGYSYLAYILCE